eukprot:2669300-Prymnesium_polylepis.1
MRSQLGRFPDLIDFALTGGQESKLRVGRGWSPHGATAFALSHRESTNAAGGQISDESTGRRRSHNRAHRGRRMKGGQTAQRRGRRQQSGRD